MLYPAELRGQHLLFFRVKHTSGRLPLIRPDPRSGCQQDDPSRIAAARGLTPPEPASSQVMPTAKSTRSRRTKKSIRPRNPATDLPTRSRRPQCAGWFALIASRAENPAFSPDFRAPRPVTDAGRAGNPSVVLKACSTRGIC
jgi:hypothetical protein